MLMSTQKVYLIVIVILALNHSYNCLTFLSKEYSFAEFPPWSARYSGSLELEFKTANPTSLLIYAEEISRKPSDEKSFIQLNLLHGSLKLVVQMGGESFWSSKKTLIGVNLNNLKWHKVVIMRVKNKTSITLDGRWSLTLTNEGDLKYLPVNSSLFIGGVGKERLRKVVSGRVRRAQRFVGCIRNVLYSTRSGFNKQDSLLASNQVASGCVDSCEQNKHTPCGNGGKCINQFSTFTCNCIGTGFKGDNCTNASDTAYFRGIDYIAWSPPRHQSVPSHHIILRFKTYLENGILFTTGSDGDSLILEVHHGNLRMSINLGGGPLEIVVGEGGLNDRRWHKVEIIRRGTFCILNLDDRLVKNGTTPGRNSKFDFPQYKKLFFAGHTNPRDLVISKSNQNFSGCMQHVYYNEIDILQKKFNTRSIMITSVGSVQLGCPVFTAPPIKTTTSKPPTTANLRVVTKATEYDVIKTTETVSPSIIKNANYGSQNGDSLSNEPLSKSQIAWITSGIIIGALVLVFTTACLVHRCKRRYNGVLISSALKNKDNRQRANQRYKGERVVFLEHATKEKLEKVTKF